MSKKGKNRDLFAEYDSAFDGSLGTGKTFAPRCYESHPVIQLGAGKLYGGSCSNPMVKTADVYIGLDGWMSFQKPKYPWAKTEAGPEEVSFKISDGCAPSDEKNFVLMIDWLTEKLEAGKTVHVGCIGGHGRTGMVLAALVNRVMGEEDAITWVRKNYCKKAVETKVQVKFLHKYFGIKEVGGSRSHSSGVGGVGGAAGYGGTYGGTYSEPPRVGPPSNGRTFSESFGDFIPGTTVPRSKGPRDLKPVSTKVVTEATMTVVGLTNSPNSVW